MLTDVGEYIVGAYLKVRLKCDFVDYNVRSPGGGLEGLGEIDVVGVDFKVDTAYLCEVTTHIQGLLYGGGNEATIERIRKKHERQKAYAAQYLDNFKHVRFMFWSPVVPKGYLTEHLASIEDLELFINGQHKRCIQELRDRAKKETANAGNPFFRTLQILEHLRD